MLSAIRTFAKSWVAAVLIGLLIVSFAVFGLNDVFRGRFDNNVITAGSRKVTQDQFKRTFDRVKGEAEQRAGRPISVEEAAQNNLHTQLLVGLTESQSFAALLDKIGLRPSDAQVAKQVGQIPAFFDQVSGRFDKKTYLAKLAENGLTSEAFEQSIRDEMAEQQLQTGMLHGLVIPRAYGALAAVFALENRDVAYFAVQPQNVAQPALPTDAQLTAFMKENEAQLTRPEMRILTVARFSPALVAANLPIDPAELQKRYEFRRDTLSTPETRSVVQIPAKDAATAQKIVAGLAGSTDPMAVARSVGVEAIIYADKPQTAIADRKAATVAFTLPANQATPVQGDLGVSVIKVTKVTPGHQVTLQEARPMLEAELRKDAASEKVYALSQAYETAHQGGASLTESAQKAGVPAVTIGPLSKEGRDAQGAPMPGLSQKLVEAAFDLPAGGESDVTPGDDGEYFAVRVERILPSAMPPLAEVKPMLTRVWMQREMMKRLQAKADELAARIRKGETLAAAAASIGVRPVELKGLDRQTAGEHQNFSPDFLTKALGGKSGDVFTGQVMPFGVAVGRIQALSSGQGPNLSRLTEETRPQMAMTVIGEMGASARAAARAKIKPKTNPDLARSAIGLAPLDPKAPKGLAQ